MRTLLNHAGNQFRADGSIHQPVAWRAQPEQHRINPIDSLRISPRFRTGSVESQAIASVAKSPYLPNSDFPFSALIDLVRELRQ